MFELIPIIVTQACFIDFDNQKLLRFRLRDLMPLNKPSTMQLELLGLTSQYIFDKFLHRPARIKAPQQLEFTRVVAASTFVEFAIVNFAVNFAPFTFVRDPPSSFVKFLRRHFPILQLLVELKRLTLWLKVECFCSWVSLFVFLDLKSIIKNI